jgi:DNA-binding beta-propeller fold protein YncE
MSVLPSKDGCALYVSVSGKGAKLPDGSAPHNGIVVLQQQNGHFVRVQFVQLQDEPAQMVLSNDERTLYVADNTAGVAELRLDASRALTLKRYLVPELRGGFFQIALSPRGDVLYGGAMKIDRVLAIPLGSPRVAQSVPADHFPVGLALSRDGRFLYVSNTVAVDPAHPRFHPVKCTYRTDPQQLAVVRDEGTLEVFDTAALARGHQGLVARVRAGCAPVRVALDEQHRIVWMTARESDVLIGYKIGDVLHARRTLPLVIRTGKSPVGLAITDDGRTLAIGNSARFEALQRSQSVRVYSMTALMSSSPVPDRVEQVGVFPRDIAITQDGTTMLVANFGSSTVTVIPLRPAHAVRAQPK